MRRGLHRHRELQGLRLQPKVRRYLELLRHRWEHDRTVGGSSEPTGSGWKKYLNLAYRGGHITKATGTAGYVCYKVNTEITVASIAGVCALSMGHIRPCVLGGTQWRRRGLTRLHETPLTGNEGVLKGVVRASVRERKRER